MSNEKIMCKDCLYWDDRFGNDGKGICRRNAPKHESVSVETDTTARYYTVLWPLTNNDDWCAEFDRK